jgi:deoxyadenosine/deoxycytidine kinase
MPDPTPSHGKLIGIVGPCGAGKSTLAGGLKQSGYNARPIAQEHSYVKDMWQRLTKPDILIFLQASHPVGAKRRNMKWTLDEWQEQQLRLLHAREHAKLFINTDDLTIAEVLGHALDFLKTSGGFQG